MLGRLVNEAIGQRGYAHPWGDMLEALRGTDMNLINLETTLTRSARAVPKTFNFRADPDRVRSLVEARIDVCNVANNHILDFGLEGMTETLETLDRAGILHAGAGRTLEEARRPVVLTRKNLTVGIVGCTDNDPGWQAGPHRPGTHYVSVDAAEELAQHVRGIRPRVDLLILTIHWGPNMRQAPTEDFVRFAHRMVDAGVDVFHGHSAHVFQGVEVYKDRLILYDTGDFVDDYYVTPSLRNDQSFFYLVQADRGGIRALELIPVLISDMQVNRARGGDRAETVRRVRALSKPFGTSFEERDGRLVVRLR